MALLIASTTINVDRPVPQDDGAFPDDPATTSIATGVRAHLNTRIIGLQSGVNGERSQVTSVLLCDPIDLQPDDLISDQQTGAQWTVEWVMERTFDTTYDYLRAGVTMRITEAGAA